MSSTATITKIFHTTIDKVWQGLTDPDIVKEYFFGTELTSDWQVGGKIQFQGSWEGKTYIDGGIILSIDAPYHLSYNYRSSWSTLPDIPENLQCITYDLNRVDERNTELTITQENCTDLAQAKHSEENWDSVLEGMRKIIEK